MIGESSKNDIEPTGLPEKIPAATDIELAMFLITHLDNPCEVEIEPGQTENIREFYLREAKAVLSKITNPEAKSLLEDKIKEYEK